MLEAWQQEWREPRRRFAWVVVLAVLVLALVSWGRFLGWVELRPGARLADPLLAVLPAIDFTWAVFTLVYGGLIGGLLVLLPTPRRLMVGLLGYALMIAVRIPAMWAVPLDPPEAMVLLEDPLIRMFGVTTTPTRDLFFSGHTASVCVIALACATRRSRQVFGAMAAAIGAMVLLQHVHYTIDVAAAPFAAVLAFRLASRAVELLRADGG